MVASLKEEYGEKHVVLLKEEQFSSWGLCANKCRGRRVPKNHMWEKNNKERKQNRISMARILLDTHVCLKKNLYQNPDWGLNQGKTLFLRR